jgi:hypothetical protein
LPHPVVHLEGKCWTASSQYQAGEGTLDGLVWRVLLAMLKEPGTRQSSQADVERRACPVKRPATQVDAAVPA